MHRNTPRWIYLEINANIRHLWPYPAHDCLLKVGSVLSIVSARSKDCKHCIYGFDSWAFLKNLK